MKDILERMTAFIAALRQRANAALTGMPPLDQMQVGREVLSAINCLQWAADDLKNMTVEADEINAKLSAYVDEQVAAKIAAEKKDGNLIDKDAHTGAISAAEKRVREEVETEKDGQIAALKRMEGNRKSLCEAVPAAIAARLGEDLLQLEDVAPAATELKRRCAALAKLGLSAEDKDAKRVTTFGNIVFCAAFDEAGNQAFDARVEEIESLGGVPKQAPGTPGRAAASQPTLTNPADGDGGNAPEKKPNLVAL